MKEDKLGNLSMELSVEVLNLVKDFIKKKRFIVKYLIGRNTSSRCVFLLFYPLKNFSNQKCTGKSFLVKLRCKVEIIIIVW